MRPFDVRGGFEGERSLLVCEIRARVIEDIRGDQEKTHASVSDHPRIRHGGHQSRSHVEGDLMGLCQMGQLATPPRGHPAISITP